MEIAYKNILGIICNSALCYHMLPVNPDKGHYLSFGNKTPRSRLLLPMPELDRSKVNSILAS